MSPITKEGGMTKGCPPEFRRRVLDPITTGSKVADVARDLGVSRFDNSTWPHRDDLIWPHPSPMVGRRRSPLQNEATGSP
jgi:hypothetical protein